MSRLIADTASRLRCSEKQVFTEASEVLGPKLYSDFRETGKFPAFIEEFCIDVLGVPKRKAVNLLKGGLFDQHIDPSASLVDDLEDDVST